jgi:hypothetical protein
MVYLRTPIGIATYDPAETPTVEDMVLKFKEENKVHFMGPWSVQDTDQNRVVLDDEVLIDGRYYYLRAFLQRV